MATAAEAREDRSVSIGRVFGRAFGTIGSNPVATLGIAFLFGALPSVLIAYVMETFGAAAFASLGAVATIGIGLFSIFTAILLAMITQGALARATVAHSEGRRASLAESAMAGLRVALPLLGLAVLSALGIGLGLLLLVAPGAILYVMWSVAAPALVEERLGPVESLRRSSDLTRGARWNIFGLLLVLLVLYWMFTALVMVLSVMSFGGIEAFTTGTGSTPVAYLVINAVGGTITSAVWGVILTSLYVELRDWKDGPRTAALADIFA